MKRVLQCSAMAVLSGFLGGCAVGYDYVLFSTKSNFGLDVDSEPPTLEMGISRRETALAPAYSGGDTPPLYGDFEADRVGALNRFFLGLSSTFAGASAAVAITRTDGCDQEEASADGATAQTSTNSIECGQYPEQSNNGQCGYTWRGCLVVPRIFDPTTKEWEKQEISYKTLFFTRRPAPPSEIRPFSFATDTIFSFKAVWITPSSAIPDSVKLGFNRKEFALTPIFTREVKTNADSPTEDFYRIEMPAFFALIHNRNDLNSTTYAKTYANVGYVSRPV